jgi:23S rRNA (adenine-N6)-dimethyltransferase
MQRFFAVSADRRTARDDRRRRLGQNFLRPDAADRLVAAMEVRPGELVVEPGAGNGSLTMALARRGADVRAIELDPIWARHLTRRAQSVVHGHVRVVEGDFLTVALPSRPFRVIGCPPFGQTTALLHRLFSEMTAGRLQRVDLILQWEVARKRAALPPTTLLGATWAPWWEFRLGQRVRASQFRPIPRVDAGLLSALPRHPPLLPPAMAGAYAAFVRSGWPFSPP